MRHSTWTPHGFSLLELLVSASILVIGILGALIAFPTSYQNFGHGGRVVQATNLAQQKIEQLRNGSFPPAAGQEAAGQYTRSWTVNVSGTSPDRLATVTVTVGWTRQTGPMNVQLLTIIPES